MKSKIIKFNNWDCEVVLNHFQATEGICLSLIGADTVNNQEQDVFPGEPIARISVNLGYDVNVKPNQTLIRTYSENEGLLELLIENGIVSKPITYYNTGHVENGVALVDVLIPIN